MHERNRRQLCRLVFVAVCVFPTLATATWAAYRVSPVYASFEKKTWERSLFERTGLLTTIQQVDHPPGGSTLLIGLELIDPDGGERIAQVRQAEIAETAHGTVVLLSQPQIAQGKFLRLWDTLHDRVLRGPSRQTALQITAGELTLEVGQRAQTFTRVHCTVEPHQTGVRAVIDFQLAGIEMPSPAQLSIERNRQIVPPVTRWQLHTDTPIPCSMFSDYIPSAGRLGPGSLFQGTVSATLARGDSHGEISGRFLQVDLDRLTEPFPYKLTGLATITLNKALMHQGVLKEVSGELTSSGGIVSPSLLISLGKHLQAAVPPELAHWQQPYVPYGRVAFEFSVSSSDMTLVGRCSETTPGVIMSSTGGELLIADNRRAYPLVAVVRALSPASDWLVPATDESKSLLNVLALPNVREAPNRSLATPPRPRVRLE